MSEQRKNDSSLSSTRQLLDELDVLMQKMLALPVGETGGESSLGKTPSTSLMDEVTDETVPESERKGGEESTADRVDDEEPPPTYSYEESDESEEQTRESESKLAPEQPEADPKTNHGKEGSHSLPSQLSPVSSETLAALTNLSAKLADEQARQRSRLLAAGTTPRRRWWLWPLTLINRGFDGFTWCLGPLGNWLRQPAGRAFLGWLGVALLLAAGGLQVVLWLLQN